MTCTVRPGVLVLSLRRRLDALPGHVSRNRTLLLEARPQDRSACVSRCHKILESRRERGSWRIKVDSDNHNASDSERCPLEKDRDRNLREAIEEARAWVAAQPDKLDLIGFSDVQCYRMERARYSALAATLTDPEAVLLGHISEESADGNVLDSEQTASLPSPTPGEAERIVEMHANTLLEIEEEHALGQYGGTGEAVREIVAGWRLAVMELILGTERVDAIYERTKVARGFNYEAAKRYREMPGCPFHPNERSRFCWHCDEVTRRVDEAFAEAVGTSGWTSIPFEALRPIGELLVELNGPAFEDERGEDFLEDGRRILERSEDGAIVRVESVEQRDARRTAKDQLPRGAASR